MTFQSNNVWLGVRVDQMDRVALAPKLWPVPLADSRHVGLLSHGEGLIPVFSLTPTSAPDQPPSQDQLVAVLVVRGEPVGLAIERAGRVYDRYRFTSTQDVSRPGALGEIDALPAHAAGLDFWFIDADLLWKEDEQQESTIH